MQQQQIFLQSNEQFEVYTTVFSPQLCRSSTRTRTRTRHVDTQKVVVTQQHQSGLQQDLDLKRGDRIQVLFKEDQTWWFGRLENGKQGFFPAACVEPLQGGASSQATPTLLRRGSVPVAMATEGPPCGCTGGSGSPRLLRKNSLRLPGLSGVSGGLSGVSGLSGSSGVSGGLSGSSGVSGGLSGSSGVSGGLSGSSGVSGGLSGVSGLSDPPHGSSSLLHRVLTKSRRKSCPHLPHLPHRPPDSGSINTAFQPD